MRDDYFDWLLDKVGFSKRGYNQLMRTLFDIQFEYIIDNDENRVKDAIDLWHEYTNMRHNDYNVSVLEILISLSMRMNYEYIMSENPDDIFWELCCNLDLDRYTDRHFNQDAVKSIVYSWINRDFDYDGEGSIFPLKETHQDQRKKEIWSQMQEYLSENYSY